MSAFGKILQKLRTDYSTLVASLLVESTCQTCNIIEMKNYNKTGVSASRKDWGEWGSAIFITTVTITIISMIMQNSYRRGFRIGIISQVPT